MGVQAVEWYKEAFSEIYPIIYAHRDDAEAGSVLDAFGDILSGSEPVLDLACGDGRYLVRALERGWRVWGVDLSEYLLIRSSERPAAEGRVCVGDMRRIPFADGSIGVVLNMFTSFGYFEADLDNLLVLREVARVLRPEGVLLLDYLNAGPAARDLPRRTTRRIAGYTVDERRSLGGGGRFLLKRVKAARDGGEAIAYTERLRVYGRKDLTTMLESVGFEVAGVFGDYRRREFDPATSPRLIMLCEKRSVA